MGEVSPVFIPCIMFNASMILWTPASTVCSAWGAQCKLGQQQVGDNNHATCKMEVGVHPSLQAKCLHCFYP